MSQFTQSQFSQKRGRTSSTGAATVIIKKARIAAPKSRVQPRRIEVKFYDTAYAITAIPGPTDASGGMADPSATSMITTVAQGDSRTNRDGGQIYIHGVEIRGIVQRAVQEEGLNPQPGAGVFVALVLDKQTNGAQMASENCFVNSIGTAASATSVMRNLDYRNRFQVMKQGWFDTSVSAMSQSAANSFSTAGVNHNFEWYLRFKKPIKVNFNATTPTSSTIVSVVDNCLHMVAYANDVSHFLSYNARIRFTD